MIYCDINKQGSTDHPPPQQFIIYRAMATTAQPSSDNFSTTQRETGRRDDRRDVEMIETIDRICGYGHIFSESRRHRWSEVDIARTSEKTLFKTLQ